MKKPLLKDTHPDMVAQFNPELNPGVDINKVTEGSGLQITWQCIKNSEHVWSVKPNNRTYYKSYGCPICSGHAPSAAKRGAPKVLSKIKSEPTKPLFMTHPDMFLELDTTKNPDTDLTKLTAGSGKKVKWTCKDCNHTWVAVPNHRTYYNTGCPACAKLVHGKGVSKLETTFVDKFRASDDFICIEQNANTGIRYKTGHSITADCMMLFKDTMAPVLFELDGEYFHSTEDKFANDTYKTKAWLTSYPTCIVVRVRTGKLAHLELNDTRLFQVTLSSPTQSKIDETFDLIAGYIKKNPTQSE